METIGIRELKARASEIVRRVREEGVAFEVSYRGLAVARLIPVAEPVAAGSAAAFLDRLDRVAEEIGQRWPAGVSAVEAIRDVRREL